MANYILIASPDKISIGSFVSFIKKYLPDYAYGDMHSLMSDDNINLYVSDFKEKHPKGILSYYAKRMVNREPMACLPEAVLKVADFVIWFDLYSTDPKILKNSDGRLDVAIGDWNKYIQKIS